MYIVCVAAFAIFLLHVLRVVAECVLRRELNGTELLHVTPPRFKDTIVNAKYGGHTEAVRRLLGQLPISAQSYSSSPYLDLSLFSYDDKWVSVMERPKTCGDHPIRYKTTGVCGALFACLSAVTVPLPSIPNRFYARDSGLLKFKIQAGLLGRPVNHAVRRLVAFTFHPFEPFAISVQRTNAEYVVNFHMRHVCA